MTGAMKIIAPRSPAQMDAFKRLNWDYRDFLLSLPPPDSGIARIAYTDEKYQRVLDAAEVENRPPRGQMRLVLHGDTPVGCGTIQTFAPGDAEIKRVWIAREAQGLGAGRALMMQLMADCRTLGFQRILMDTGRVLQTAAGLYDRLGFVRRGPYQPMPPEADDIMIYFEMPLS